MNDPHPPWSKEAEGALCSSLSSRWPSLPQVSSQPSPKLLHQDVFRCLFTLCHPLLHVKPTLDHSGKLWGLFCDHRGTRKGQHVAPGVTCLGPRLVQGCPWSPRSETHSSITLSLFPGLWWRGPCRRQGSCRMLCRGWQQALLMACEGQLVWTGAVGWWVLENVTQLLTQVLSETAPESGQHRSLCPTP